MAAAPAAGAKVATLGAVDTAPWTAAGAAVVAASPQGLPLLAAGQFTHVLAAVDATGADAFTQAGHLTPIKALLGPGGVYQHRETSGRKAADVALELLLAGFEVAGEPVAHAGGFTLTGRVPGYDAGASAPLPARSAAAAWGVAPAAGSGELVDEEALLAGDNAADAIKAPADCSSKPRACADCSCGRAEAEAKAVQLSEDQLQSFTSSCGNCFKGDAFRCASCPHRGKPAFKAGLEGVTLDLDAGDDLGGPIALA